jgi:hypothetical protein
MGKLYYYCLFDVLSHCLATSLYVHFQSTPQYLDRDDARRL